MRSLILKTLKIDALERLKEQSLCKSRSLRTRSVVRIWFDYDVLDIYLIYYSITVERRHALLARILTVISNESINRQKAYWLGRSFNEIEKPHFGDK